VQTAPHAPQLFGSEARFAQLAGHAVRPSVQLHAPLVQLWVPAQALLHMPQWRGSLATVVHPLLQTSCPTAHCAPPAVPLAPPIPAPAMPPVPPPSSSSSELVPSPPVPWAEQLAPITKSVPKTVSPSVVRMAQFLAYPAIPRNRKSADFACRALRVFSIRNRFQLASNLHPTTEGVRSSNFRTKCEARNNDARWLSRLCGLVRRGGDGVLTEIGTSPYCKARPGARPTAVRRTERR
jgi:hypothetical protein